MFKWLKKLRTPASVWQVEYIVEQEVQFVDDDGREVVGGKETITFYLEKDQFGNRQYTWHEYGQSKLLGKHENFEAEMKLWVKTGIVPRGAKNILAEKLKN
jgi:hypothetical protein